MPVRDHIPHEIIPIDQYRHLILLWFRNFKELKTLSRIYKVRRSFLMQCPRCLNTDQAYFYKGSRGWYCRRCISFGRIMLEEEHEPVSLTPVSVESEEYTLQYPLTKAQAEIAVKCAELIDTSDVLIHAVCGASKN